MRTVRLAYTFPCADGKPSPCGRSNLQKYNLLALSMAPGETRETTGSPARAPDDSVALQQAVRALRAISHTYETGRKVDSDYGRAYSVHVAMGHADIAWVTATIEALEEDIAASLTDRTITAR
jgi:hypothetical protein